MLRTEELINNNIPLIKFIIKKMKLFPTASADYEDLVSIGKIGLLIATKKYDASKGVNFSTYAYYCIFNEFCTYLRKEKKSPITCSLEEQNKNIEGIKHMELKKFNTSNEKNVEEIIEAEQELTDVVNIILNCLNSRDRLIMLYYLAGLKQADIANIIYSTQITVSRTERKVVKQIEEKYYDRKKIKEVCGMEIVNNRYNFRFFVNNMGNSMILSSMLNYLEKEKKNLKFEVFRYKKYITISLPKSRQAFYIIAQFIQKFDELLEYLSSI